MWRFTSQAKRFFPLRLRQGELHVLDMFVSNAYPALVLR